MDQQTITITGCTILPMTGAGVVIESGYVSVTDGVITGVQAGEPPAAQGETLIDGRGMVLMPGLGERPHPSLPSVVAGGLGGHAVSGVAEAYLWGG